MVAGPEVARFVNEFECSLEVTKGDQGKKPDCCYHEQMKGVRKAFEKQVVSLSTTITDNDLLVLDTQDIMLV